MAVPNSPVFFTAIAFIEVAGKLKDLEVEGYLFTPIFRPFG
ncbi:hypothetical protein [Nostoc sp. NMS7]|nr:hypothetical protein [Nostoc sp. NMS7]